MAVDEGDRGYREKGNSGGEPSGTSGGEGIENKHSRLGITSFVFFILSVVLFVGALVVSFVVLGPIIQDIDPQVIQDPQSIQNPEDLPPELREQAERALLPLLLVSVGFLGAPFLSFVGVVFGVAGLIQGRRKKIFATLGTVLNGLALIAAIALLFVGLIGGAAGVPAG